MKYERKKYPINKSEAMHTIIFVFVLYPEFNTEIRGIIISI